MEANAAKYVTVECTGSFLVNGLLNLGAGYLLFQGRASIPVGGPTGLLRDSIGETFLVTSLSYLVAALISRRRSRAGTLPQTASRRVPSAGNLYLRAFVIGLFFTLVLYPVNAWLLPRFFPDGLTLWGVVTAKTLYGAALGAIASWLAIFRALSEVPLRAQAIKV